MLNYFCCCNLTIATRIIGTLGIAMSIIMINFLIYDRNGKQFESTSVMINFFGFDWQSFTEPTFHYHGEFFFFIIIIKIIFNLLTNFILIFSTILESKFYTVPWLIWNTFLILTKFISFAIHLIRDYEYISLLFIVSSAVYLVILLWWLIVVVGTVLYWKKNTNNDLDITLVNTTMNRDMSVFESPMPYICNIQYSEV